MARPIPTGGLHPEITLPHEQEWELYHNSFSLCSKKLRVCMEELGFSYKSNHIHLIETGAYESCSPAFLKINPAATVPVVVHNGHPVYESHDQIVYLAEHAAPDSVSLVPAGTDKRAEMEKWVDCASLVGNPLEGLDQRAGHCIPGLTVPIFATMVQYIPYGEILKGLFTHPNKERPLLFALMKFFGAPAIARGGNARKLITQSREHMNTHLDALEEQLRNHGQDWIVGDQFTLADVSWVVLLDRLVECDWDAYFWGGDRRPYVASYWHRLTERPSYQHQVVEKRSSISLKGMQDLTDLKQKLPKFRQALEGA